MKKNLLISVLSLSLFILSSCGGDGGGGSSSFSWDEKNSKQALSGSLGVIFSLLDPSFIGSGYLLQTATIQTVAVSEKQKCIEGGFKTVTKEQNHIKIQYDNCQEGGSIRHGTVETIVDGSVSSQFSTVSSITTKFTNFSSFTGFDSFESKDAVVTVSNIAFDSNIDMQSGRITLVGEIKGVKDGYSFSSQVKEFSMNFSYTPVGTMNISVSSTMKDNCLNADISQTSILSIFGNSIISAQLQLTAQNNLLSVTINSTDVSMKFADKTVNTSLSELKKQSC